MTAGLYEQSYPPSLWEPAPPEPPTPTAAVAGIPGHYTPAGAAVPADEASFRALALPAVPATAWTVGQYIATGDATQLHWDGTAWVAGAAVAAAEPPPAEPPPEEPAP